MHNLNLFCFSVVVDEDYKDSDDDNKIMKPQKKNLSWLYECS